MANARVVEVSAWLDPMPINLTSSVEKRQIYVPKPSDCGTPFPPAHQRPRRTKITRCFEQNCVAMEVQEFPLALRETPNADHLFSLYAHALEPRTVR